SDWSKTYGPMSKVTSREIRLASRPKGLPIANNFSLAKVELEPPKEAHVLVRNLYMSVDPYMRGRMNDRKSYVPPFELGKPLEGAAIGEVIESRAPEFEPGDAVSSSLGWREYFCVSAKVLRPVNRDIQPLSVYFDNVGSETLEAALSALRVHGRIIACGSISIYNDEKPRPGPSNLFNITTRRLTMKGLMVLDWLERWAEFEKEVGGYFRAGKL